MANDPKNIRLGPCRVRWGGIDLGLTKGGVEVEVTTQTKEVTVDQFGETPVNEYVTGRKLVIKAPFAETDVDTLHLLMRDVGSTMVNDGVQAAGNITVATQPVTNDTVVVNGVTFTFKTAGTAVATTDVNLGATAVATAAMLLLQLQFSTNPLVAVATYSADSAVAGKINVLYRTTGVVGNAFTLVKTGTGVTVGAATLTAGTATTRKRIEMTNAVGTSMYANARELVLRPKDKLDGDFSEDFIIPTAATSGALQFSYKLDTERLFNLTFNGYPNTSTGLLFMYGDRR